MIDREKVKKDLTHCHGMYPCTGCSHRGHHDCASKLNKNALTSIEELEAENAALLSLHNTTAEYAQELLERLPKWVSVEECEPTVSNSYYVLTNDGICAAEWDCGDEWDTDCITHWLDVTFPLPTPKPEPKRWRAEKGGKYQYVNSYGEVEDKTDTYLSFNDFHCSVGNYFQTEQEARESKFYKVFHEEEQNTCSQ